MWQIYFKELLELVRDRKTLFFIIALPLLVFPVIFGLMGFVVANAAIEEQQKVLNYVVINEQQAPEFSDAIFYHRDFKKVDIALIDEQAIYQAIANQSLDVVIKISEDHSEKREHFAQDKWQVYYNGASQLSAVRKKVRDVFNRYLKKSRAQHLTHLGLTELQFNQLEKPVTLEMVDTADERESFGEQLGGMLPYLLIVLCLTGAMYPAIDIGAGEKERGTLETLLLTPISRFSIVLGKFFTVMTTGIITALIAVFSLVFWSYIIGEIAGIEVVKRILTSVGTIDLVLILMMLVPVSAIFAALLLAISIYARSFKEAQNYMGPMSMLGFFPVMVAMLPGIELNEKWSLVPISNVALAIKEILKGTIDYNMLVYIFISTLIFAILSILFCVHWFNKETVLFR